MGYIYPGQASRRKRFMNDSDFDPIPGVAEWLEPGVRRVLAPNPSPMTYRGTNTYIVGQGRVAVIDPGPALPDHMRAIQAALEPGEVITGILVTHSHVDHSPLAAPLAAATGAPVHAFGDSLAGRSAAMESLASQGLTGGGEGVDFGFAPDEFLADSAIVDGDDWQIRALWTPGHFGNHLSFAFGDAVFTGDTVMGWASTMVSPPDGDLGAFLRSAAQLAATDARVFYPGHGAAIARPRARAEWLIAHRNRREAEILAHLDGAGTDIATLTRTIYHDVPVALLPAAERNVFAHLIDLHAKQRVQAEPHLSYAA
ncbi:MAG: MBL fold metallo-hydrolase, partial [Rhodobacter sp.]|nr:MBL fold metallo-hydrolase [Rhodobacter sp.]